MGEESRLITDLALILISAGVMTLVFKILKQPLVLGYIVAGFLVGPHFGLFPSVMETSSIQEWSEIGIIFLLFALGLEFSFKKLLKSGSTAIITALVGVVLVMLLGILTGHFMGWTTMESVFLGGMLSMSSTVIVIKAYDDLGVKKTQFAEITMAVLIIQDLVAVVMMVLLSTVAVGKNFEGTEMLFSILKLIFFLVLWFVIGIYLIPTFFKKFKKRMNDETLLIISLGFCFGMVVLAESTGFSSALGAFVMGSLLAETIEAERIEHLTKSIKDLFGAIFFVSVGMMVNPTIIATYWWQILILTIITIFGKTVFSAVGALIAGQNIKTSMQVGFSLSQVGEFAFIIATLGMSLHVLSDFIYPVIVAVSVITIFTTPYCIRLSEPIANWIEKKMPPRMKAILTRFSSGNNTVNQQSEWSKLLKSYITRVGVFSVVIVAIIVFAFSWFQPFVQQIFEKYGLSTTLGNVLWAAVAIMVLSPFLRGLLVQRKDDEERFAKLWSDNRFNKGLLITLSLSKMFLVVFFVSMVLMNTFEAKTWTLIVVAIAVLVFILVSRKSFRRFSKIEKHFVSNLNERENEQKKKNPIRASFESKFSGKDIHLSHVLVSPNYDMIGKTLSELNFIDVYQVSIVKIERGNKEIYFPSGDDYIYPYDHLVVMGTDEQLNKFNHVLESQSAETSLVKKAEMIISSLVIDRNSPYLGKTIAMSGIRHPGNCMVIGFERDGVEYFNPSIQTEFEIDDLVWVVGEKHDVEKLL